VCLPIYCPLFKCLTHKTLKLYLCETLAFNIFKCKSWWHEERADWANFPKIYGQHEAHWYMPNCLQIDCIINNAHRGPTKASFALIANSMENVSRQGVCVSVSGTGGRVKCKIFQQSTPYVIWQTTNFGNKSNNRRRCRL